MNWNRGLRRLLAVFWGVIGFMAALAQFTAYSQPVMKAAGIAIASIAFCFLAFRVCCWIVDGFTARR